MKNKKTWIYFEYENGCIIKQGLWEWFRFKIINLFYFTPRRYLYRYLLDYLKRK